MHLWSERKIPENANANIDQTETRMIDHDVTAALRAIPAVTDFAALESPEEFCALSTLTFSFFHNVNALTGAAE